MIDIARPNPRSRLGVWIVAISRTAIGIYTGWAIAEFAKVGPRDWYHLTIVSSGMFLLGWNFCAMYYTGKEAKRAVGEMERLARVLGFADRLDTLASRKPSDTE